MRVVVGSGVTPKSHGEKPNGAMAETVKSEVRFGRRWPPSGDLGVDTASGRCGKKRQGEQNSVHLVETQVSMGDPTMDDCISFRCS